VTLSCQRHCRGTVQNCTRKTESPTVSSRGQTAVILCSTITIA